MRKGEWGKTVIAGQGDQVIILSIGCFMCFIFICIYPIIVLGYRCIFPCDTQRFWRNDEQTL